MTPLSACALLGTDAIADRDALAALADILRVLGALGGECSVIAPG